jgi:hypothetical protein
LGLESFPEFLKSLINAKQQVAVFFDLVIKLANLFSKATPSVHSRTFQDLIGQCLEDLSGGFADFRSLFIPFSVWDCTIDAFFGRLTFRFDMSNQFGYAKQDK